MATFVYFLSVETRDLDFSKLIVVVKIIYFSIYIYLSISLSIYSLTDQLSPVSLLSISYYLSLSSLPPLFLFLSLYYLSLLIYLSIGLYPYFLLSISFFSPSLLVILPLLKLHDNISKFENVFFF